MSVVKIEKSLSQILNASSSLLVVEDYMLTANITTVPT